MATENTTGNERRTDSKRPVLPDGDAAWLGVALAAGLTVYASYLLTHRYPAYAGGLYVQMAEELIAHGYRLPASVPYYAGGRVPFAYPPLGFYVAALLRSAGVDPVALTLYLPGALVVAYLVPYYAVARDLLGSPRRAGVATLLFAVTPTVLRWHLSAGGIVRALALLLALSGVYAGLRLFRTGDRRWVAPATVLFALTVLTHPVYTVFFGLSYLLAFAAFDRSWRGLAAGATVAVGGLALAAPWWLQVGATHGFDVFLTASGTHSGLAGGPHRLVSQFVYPVVEDDALLGVELNPEVAFYLLAYAGGAYALSEERYVLPAWAATASYVIGKNRFLFVAGAMLGAVFVLDAVAPAVRRRVDGVVVRRAASVAAVALVVAAAGGAGVLYAGGVLDTAHEHSHTQPAYMDAEDEAAMAWAAANTGPSARFVVVGDAAEWFPLFAERTIVLGPWGYEWKDAQGYYDEVELYRNVSSCRNATCLTRRLDRAGRHPDYVYLPKGAYTVRGKEHSMPGYAIEAVADSGRYRLVYENRGVAVFRVVDWPTNAG